jgi:hypothetical protein
MSKEYKIPLKRVVLIGLILVVVVTSITTLFDLFIWDKEFSIQKLLFRVLVFGILYAVFHKRIIKI